MTLQLIGWVCTVSVLAAYAYTAHTERPFVFNVVNVPTSILLGYFNYSLGAYPTVALNAVFGSLGAYGAWRHLSRPEVAG